MADHEAPSKWATLLEALTSKRNRRRIYVATIVLAVSAALAAGFTPEDIDATATAVVDAVERVAQAVAALGGGLALLNLTDDDDSAGAVAA